MITRILHFWALAKRVESGSRICKRGLPLPAPTPKNENVSIIKRVRGKDLSLDDCPSAVMQFCRGWRINSATTRVQQYCWWYLCHCNIFLATHLDILPLKVSSSSTWVLTWHVMARKALLGSSKLTPFAFDCPPPSPGTRFSFCWVWSFYSQWMMATWPWVLSGISRVPNIDICQCQMLLPFSRRSFSGIWIPSMKK